MIIYIILYYFIIFYIFLHFFTFYLTKLLNFVHMYSPSSDQTQRISECSNAFLPDPPPFASRICVMTRSLCAMVVALKTFSALAGGPADVADSQCPVKGSEEDSFPQAILILAAAFFVAGSLTGFCVGILCAKRKLGSTASEQLLAASVLQRALTEIQDHMGKCPFNNDIYITPRGKVWHAHRSCQYLKDIPDCNLTQYKPCPACATLKDKFKPGDIVNHKGRTLKDEIQMLGL